MESMLSNPLAVRILSHADDKLMLGHVQSDWTGLGPILEEDIASSAMAQDDLSHALTLYQYLGDRYDLDPDVIAFERSAENYFCCDLVTQSDEFDWAGSVVKRWLMATYMLIVIADLSKADDDSDLGPRCDRILPEQELQVLHLQRWIIRLSNAGDEARERMQLALDRIAPLAGMVVEMPGHGPSPQESCLIRREEIFREWTAGLHETIKQAGLNATFSLPEQTQLGGRRSRHADHFKEQLVEMTEVRRVDPGASW